MPKQTIYTVGGTVQAGGGIYIKRKADDDLLELCRQGEFAFILSSRQVGKSSLMVRTAQQLEKENVCSVIIDLSAIGVNVSQDEWYLGILNEIYSALNLETDIFAWWSQYAQLGQAQRLTNFFKDVLLKEVKERVVLFFDEIDSTLSIPFSDDFYIALRSVYNARSTVPDFKRLSFVLVGVAAPGDLISDNKRTPFNIGHRVEINDFTLAEALPLAQGLGEQAVQILTWIFQYTNGHPYLTQRLCAYLAGSGDRVNEQVVAAAVDKLFTGEQGKQDNNLQFVRDMLSKRSPDVTRILSIYKAIRSGKTVPDDERSITKAHLKLSGLVRSEQRNLRVRNEIYNRVFNLHWIQENTPKNWQKVALVSLSAVLGILILGLLAVFVNDYFVGSRRDQHFRSFISASSPEQRLTDLAEIYKRKGILSNQDSDLTASQLFYGLSTADDQLALFRIYNIHDKPALERDLIIVISHLHTTVANVDPEEDNTKLLQFMLAALENVQDDSISNMKKELGAWIDGRKGYENGDYANALANYSVALGYSPGNHALLYERAKVYVALGLYTDALKDLDAAIEAAKKSAPDIGTPVPTVESTETVLLSEPTSGSTGIGIQTPIQANETRDPRSAITSFPISGSETPTISTTPSSETTATPTLIPTAVPTYILPPKYESNFTTLIDVVNAVQALINNTPELQVAMQVNKPDEYANLKSFGLVVVIPATQPSISGTKVSLVTPEAPSVTEVPVPADRYMLYVVEDDLALRAEPSSNGYLWKRLVLGTELICLEPKATAKEKVGRIDQWIHVQDPNGDQGYVAAWYVSDVKSLPTGFAPINGATSSTSQPTSVPAIIQNTELSSGFRLIHYYQNDPQWKDVKLGNSSETIGSWGQLVTVYAMLLDGYGYNETPETVNEKMKKAGGFEGAFFIPSVVPYIWSNIAYIDLQPTESSPVPLEQIDAFLAQGKPVILQVDWNKQAGIQTHFVLAYARKGDDYLILDPYKYDGDSPDKEVLLTERYNHNGGTLDTEISAVLWNRYAGQ